MLSILGASLRLTCDLLFAFVANTGETTGTNIKTRSRQLTIRLNIIYPPLFWPIDGTLLYDARMKKAIGITPLTIG
jgi:hypothetical protein